mmetsp:Transcript_14641/g.25000  ORF Transcript_14641/g.25000 Transcript_14641/m.25000 type:complete len:327 (-) Transcript_14641:704-1684(-)|eukprot:CAMPEP_0196661190 /NCGR_PEP_ID=MMETSP1086-20130531/43127_1 /TAXON_ID=77921 /ORGANISM="Cyanoptyche  gloeocystis , Strain SAG4.97" /LENGTH=326 /DNA_ID=CAMNT_0041995973 /DNA_START=45 /DNA_END=1025 /DNA_ORIENTATION=+
MGLSSSKSRSKKKSGTGTQVAAADYFDQIRTPLVTFTAEGVLSFVNLPASSVLGGFPEELQGKSLFQLGENFSCSKTITPGTNITTLIGERITFNGKKDGQTKPTFVELIPSEINPKNGGAKILIGVLRDLSDLTELKTNLEKSELQRTAVIDTSVDGVVLLDSNHVIRAVNDAACKMFGYTRDELVNQDMSIIVPPPWKEKHKSYVDNYLRTGEAKIIGWGREVQAERKDKTLHPISLSVSEACEIGTDRFFLGICRDMSVRKQAETSMAKNKAWVQSVLDCVTHNIVTVDNDGKLVSHPQGWDNVKPSRRPVDGARPSIQITKR